MHKVAILTPSYNRAGTLRRCYNSLLRQTCKDFVWIIVDDGSSDDTRNEVENFINDQKIGIRYIYKKNGGKHTALNLGIGQINNELTLILDSDDYLTDDAIAEIMFYHKKYKTHKEICGFTFLKVFQSGKVIGMKFSKNEDIGSYIEKRLNENIKGDKCEVFYTRCLKECPFPEFEGEKFIAESTVWIQIGLKFEMVHINKSIYVADYLEDGLTKQGKKLRISCPNGGIANSKMRMTKKCCMKLRIKAGILYSTYSFFLNKKIKNIIYDNEYKGLTILTMPLGYLLYRYWKDKYK